MENFVMEILKMSYDENLSTCTVWKEVKQVIYSWGNHIHDFPDLDY